MPMTLFSQITGSSTVSATQACKTAPHEVDIINSESMGLAIQDGFNSEVNRVIADLCDRPLYTASPGLVSLINLADLSLDPSSSPATTSQPSPILDLSNSDMSSPTLVHTPLYITTRRNQNPSQSSSATLMVGLGIQGLFKEDGTIFDGLGFLSYRDHADYDPVLAMLSPDNLLDKGLSTNAVGRDRTKVDWWGWVTERDTSFDASVYAFKMPQMSQQRSQKAASANTVARHARHRFTFSDVSPPRFDNLPQSGPSNLILSEQPLTPSVNVGHGATLDNSISPSRRLHQKITRKSAKQSAVVPFIPNQDDVFYDGTASLVFPTKSDGTKMCSIKDVGDRAESGMTWRLNELPPVTR